MADEAAAAATATAAAPVTPQSQVVALQRRHDDDAAAAALALLQKRQQHLGEGGTAHPRLQQGSDAANAAAIVLPQHQEDVAALALAKEIGGRGRRNSQHA